MQKLVIPLLVILCFNACKTKAQKEPVIVADQTISGKFSPPTEKVFDSTAINIFFDSFPKFSGIRQDMAIFYRGRDYSYAWFDEKGMIEQAANLYNKIKTISEEGVSSERMLYQAELNAVMENQSGQFDSSALATELMLTAQYLQYARTVWQGLDEKESLALQWLLPRKNLSYTKILDSLLSGKDVLTDAPVYRQYYLLKNYLQKYRASEAADTALILPKGIPIIKGDSSFSIRQLQHKLFLLGDLAAPGEQRQIFDDSLENAVKRFQKRIGLKVNGKVGKAEITELNISIRQRIEQILVNMERSRWVTRNPPPNHLIVNIPEYKLHAIENDSLAWNMNVVVGKNQHKTVVFNGDIKYVVFSPYWNVPASILKNEILPGIKRNRNYLASHGMEWNGGNVRQKPGPNNALGLVKFLFPNSHSIYLHDSPAKSLFNETNRAFSHGCIRLAEPKKLALYLLRADTAWDEARVTAAMNAAKEKYVTLKKPVPVFIVYFTAWVGRDGQLNFRKDIYDRDKRLLEMLISPGQEPEKRENNLK